MAQIRAFTPHDRDRQPIPARTAGLRGWHQGIKASTTICDERAATDNNRRIGAGTLRVRVPGTRGRGHMLA
jgi:hypothetical protein